VLAERAPDLREALERALADGAPHVILDGTLISSDRCQEKTTGSRYKIARAALVLTLRCAIDTDRPSSSHATKTAQAVPGVPAVALVTRADQR
jgi:hypothetical protein